MEIILDCLPCNMRQALEAARMATDDERLLARIIDEAIAVLADYRAYRNSPDLCRAMHNIIRKNTGVMDMYKKVKERDIAAALKVYPLLKQYVSEGDSLSRALKVAVTGNVIDAAVDANVDIEQCVSQELQIPFGISDEDTLRQYLNKASRLLYIGDNAGETVFDRVLLESLPKMEITYAARGGPAINDATVEDALASGLSDCARVISTGCDIPGVNMDETTEEFRRCFQQADIVICKGQGNYETLSDSGRSVFFLLKCKCGALARILNVRTGDYVLQYNC